MFFGRNDAKAETLAWFWPPHAKSWLTRKVSHAGRDWGQKGMTEDEMTGMASPTRWTWVWVDSRSWLWTGRPGLLWFMGLQKVGHNWVTELNWTVDKPLKNFALLQICMYQYNSEPPWSPLSGHRAVDSPCPRKVPQIILFRNCYSCLNLTSLLLGNTFLISTLSLSCNRFLS